MKYVIHVYSGYWPDQISHTQSMVGFWWLKDKSGKYSYHLWNSHLKYIPIDPAIWAAIGHHFLAKKKIKNADQKPDTFFWGGGGLKDAFIFTTHYFYNDFF